MAKTFFARSSVAGIGMGSLASIAALTLPATLSLVGWSSGAFAQTTITITNTNTNTSTSTSTSTNTNTTTNTNTSTSTSTANGAGTGSGTGGGGTGGGGTGGGGTGGGGGGGTTPTPAADPGVRGGAPGAGGPLAGLDGVEVAFFTAGQGVFAEVDAVANGLGPRFNMNSCSGCHAQPAVGGSSPFVNPQMAVATLAGARNTVPAFIMTMGPVREARFVSNPDGSPDGGVHDLFVISGRTDAPGCNITQPDFGAAAAANNVIFRTPTPIFGAGLVENTPDATLLSSFASTATMRGSLGISGHFNRSGNDGTITRFGWKAQNKSLMIFAGEAYNVEQGVTNEAFPNERESDPNCQFNPTPEDHTPLVNEANSGSPARDFSSDVVNFAGFMRLSAPPTPAMAMSSTTMTQGQTVFTNIGCAACHTPTLTTGMSSSTGQSNVMFQPFSDIAVHDMGMGLADRVSQGNAGGQEFRSAPLWGVGQRIFFLHDGRTSDIIQAIQQHSSSGSEATMVINNFNMLSSSDQQALVTFLRQL